MTSSFMGSNFEAYGPNIDNLAKNLLNLFTPPSDDPPSVQVEKILFTLDSQKQAVPFSLSRCEYMRMPLDLLDSYKYNKIIFMGPARTGKSEALIKGGLAYTIANQQDSLLLHMSETHANEFGKGELKPMIDRSPDLAKFKPANEKQEYTNNFIIFKNRNKIWVKWPSVTSLASITVQYAFSTDYDRMQGDLGGEGSPAILLSRRTQTYGNRAKTIIESSPGKVCLAFDELEPHQAPPADGIASLYNGGTRHVYYVPCSHCQEWFWANPDTIKWNKTDISLSANERAKTAYVECPHCLGDHYQDDINRWCQGEGKWLAEGQKITSDGEIIGKPIDTTTASFWLRAPICAFNELWRIVEEYIKAEEKYDLTGADNDLKSIINTVYGDPYVQKERSNRDNLTLERLRGDFENGIAPEDTRVLIAAVDVQAGKNGCFEVNIFGLSEQNVTYLIDNFEIKTYNDKPIKPSINEDDWQVLIHNVLDYTARIDNTNKVLRVAHVVCDSGGLGETTNNAYRFAEYLKRPELFPYSRRFHLVKGEARVNNDNIVRKGSHRDLLLINTQMTKNDIAGRLTLAPYTAKSFVAARDIPEAKLKQLFSEERDINGKWVKRFDKIRNELLDCFSYYIGLCHHLGYYKYLKNGRFEGGSPPPELMPYKSNINCFEVNEIDTTGSNYAEKVRFTKQQEDHIKSQIQSQQRQRRRLQFKGGFSR